MIKCGEILLLFYEKLTVKAENLPTVCAFNYNKTNS